MSNIHESGNHFGTEALNDVFIAGEDNSSNKKGKSYKVKVRTRESVLADAQKDANATGNPQCIFRRNDRWYNSEHLAQDETAEDYELVHASEQVKTGFGKVTVSAKHNITHKPILGLDGLPISQTRDISTDVPADVLGELTAHIMQLAWRTGPDATEIMLEVQFS